MSLSGGRRVVIGYIPSEENPTDILVVTEYLAATTRSVFCQYTLSDFGIPESFLASALDELGVGQQEDGGEASGSGSTHHVFPPAAAPAAAAPSGSVPASLIAADGKQQWVSVSAVVSPPSPQT